MKNRFVCFLFGLLFLAFPAIAEEGFVTLGIKGGIGLAGLWGRDVVDSAGMTASFRSGLCAGALVALNFTENVSGQLELLYSMKGNSSAGDYSLYSKGVTIRTDYVEAPLLLKVGLRISDISRFILCVGPTFSINVYSKTDSSLVDQTTNYSSDVTVDSKQRTALFDIGATVGAGMGIKGGPGDVVFEIRYTLGLLSTDKLTGAQKQAGDRQPDIKNSYIAFLLGYSITL